MVDVLLIFCFWAMVVGPCMMAMRADKRDRE